MSNVGWGLVLCGYAALVTLLAVTGQGLIERLTVWWRRRG